jgi:hypothetical protein
MFANVVPLFARGRILKKEMLENLRDFPRNFFDIYFADYSDGVIAGADVIIGEDKITIAKGIVKHDQCLYLLEDCLQIPYFNINKEILIKVRFLTEEAAGDFRFRRTEVVLDDNLEITGDEMELGRFKLREGAMLRSDYTDFFDLATEYNTINVIHAPHAAPGMATLNPMILRYFARIVLKCNSDNAYDLNFAMTCLSQKPISRELILYYLTNRRELEYQEYTNFEIYRHLALIIKELESGVKQHHGPKQSEMERIIID